MAIAEMARVGLRTQPVAAVWTKHLVDVDWGRPTVLPFERVILGYCLVALLISSAFGFEIDWMATVDFRVELNLLVSVCPPFLLIFALIDVVRRRLRMFKAWAQIRSEYVSYARGWVREWRNWHELFRALVAYKICMLVYTSLKSQIALIHPQLFDETLRRVDRALHFGVEPMAALPSSFLAAAPCASVIDWSYIAWYAVVIAITTYMMFLAPRRLRLHFFTCFFLLWAIGGLLAVLVPSLGPCYTNPELFAHLDVPNAQRLQAWLLDQHLTGAAKGSGGIAAFPSLHVGLSVLFTLFLFRWKIVFAAMLTFTAVIMVGSVYLGWHYAVDGYTSALLASALFFGTRAAFREPPEDTAPLS